MSFNLDDANVGGQIKVGTGIFPAIGEGVTRVNGSAGIEGPIVMGNPTTFPFPYATVNIAPLTNSDNKVGPLIPGLFCYGLPANPFSLAVNGGAGFLGRVDTAQDVIVGGNCLVQGNVISNCGGHVLAAKKDFDIKHPSKDGWRLRYVAPEAPSADVYCRGRVTNKTEIILPLYWKDLVDWTTITVNLTPIGAHQNVIVKRIDEEKVYLQAHGGMPINCFYHIYAERQDCERNIAEYEGESPADYPGDNSQYLQSGG
tara:strand:- start:1586 stop:2356 length:771 start_codon:yes stop_codon:yes gene_type:complete